VTGAYVVTGGTGALGAEVVRALAAGGAQVAVPYRRASGWDALRAALPAGAELWGAPADLADPAATKAFMDAAAARLGRLDGLAVISGAYRGSGPLEQAPEEEWSEMMTANLATAWSSIRAVLPHLLARGGSIVTVSSRLAAEGGAGSAAYAVSKAGVMALTRVVALENRGRGVRANCVLPGTIDTPENRAAMPGANPRAWTPPAAIARVIAFLLSADSAPTTGAMMPVDGPS
jgi:NAD(P)-dependent dehydrogenase (short-subunit alcohol dehydrogenase family)